MRIKFKLHLVTLLVTLPFAVLSLVGFAAPYSVSADGAEVTDEATGLIWRRCAEGLSGSDCAIGRAQCGFTYEKSLEHAKAIAAASGVAWRLPNVEEIASIFEKSRTNPAIDVTAFPATPARFFWSASPYSASPDKGEPAYAWIAEFDFGNVAQILRMNMHCVRLVRGKQLVDKSQSVSNVVPDRYPWDRLTFPQKNGLF